MEMIVALSMWFLGILFAILADDDNIVSPVGMMVGTLGIMLLIPQFFELGELWGYGIVFFTLLYVICTGRAAQIYFRLNKKD